ncbi:MAG: DNA polymerase/3'-5' exonuclease PolX [Candidatus Krumholzibacteria bacterium]|nr:DNA polymerase/3'-5' exonuclease PolX [Candidatus Krumholzibacteria bacterium]
MKNREIAALFDEIADILELRGENVFRVNAYRRAAQNIEGLTRAIEDVADEDRLDELPGIGKDLAGKIAEYLESGEIDYLNDLRKETPRVLLDMLRIPGIGPKTAVRLHAELAIDSLEELKQAALDHQIQKLPKMKAKTEENILKGLEFLSRASARTPIGVALPLAQRIVGALAQLGEVDRISIAGSLRRFRETIGDIDILVTSSAPERVIRHFTHLDDAARILAEGSTKGSIVTREKIQADLRVVEEASYGSALNYFTGSKEHNIRLREIAIQEGMKLSEYGVFRAGGGARKKPRAGKKAPKEVRIAGRTEEEVYRVLGLPYIPPELREDSGEIEAALAGTLPALVELKDIRGDLHCHSNFSDGAATLKEIAASGKKKGYSYILITDHSQSLHIAGGLSPERLRKQLGEIDSINATLRGFKLLRGSEVDILPDGSLDMSEELLKRLDVVYIAIHSKFKMDRGAMTKRVVRAMENPYANVLAHPTGRLLGMRDAFDIDMQEVIRAAARTGTAIEINAHPARLDLDAAACRAAAAAGVMIGIGTDTHVLSELDYMIYGLGTARRGWLTAANILNTRTARQLVSLLQRKRRT